MYKLNVGQIIEADVSDFGASGEGVIKLDGYPVFVPFTAVGERVKAKITHAKKDVAFAECIEIITQSKHRVKPKCPYFMRCGGCDLQHIAYAEQLRIKSENIRRSFAKYCGLQVEVPLPVTGGEWEYRNKLSLPFGVTKSGKTVLGFYEKMSHNVVPLKWCPLHGEWAGNLIEAVLSWANDNKISVYNENSGKGLLRHVVARMLDSLCLTIVINGASLPYLDGLVENLNKYFCSYQVYISPNTEKNNVIIGDTVRPVYGEPQQQKLGAFSAEISPLSFLQVNNKVRDLLYDEVCNQLTDVSGKIVELYSGVGLLTAQLASRLPNAEITAVEIIPEATENADKLMQKLGFADRVLNITADAREFIISYLNGFSCDNAENKSASDNGISKIQDLFKNGKSDNISCLSSDNSQNGCTNVGLYDKPTDSSLLNKKNIICLNYIPLNDSTLIDNTVTNKVSSSINIGAFILDPPRGGCDAAIMQAIAQSNVSKVVYISCNPSTLCRDLKPLLAAGYVITVLQPFDMFPQTSHVETLVCLSRK